MVKCISPWSFLKGLISKLRYNHQALQDWNKARNPQEHLSRIWQSLKRRQFGNNYLQLNCWTWIVLSAMFQTGFMTARRSMFQHFSLFDNDCQRSSMTLENKHRVVVIAFGVSNEERWCKVVFSSGILSARAPHPMIKKPVALLHSKRWSWWLVSSWHMII